MEAVNKANEYAGQLANQTVAKANQHTDEQVNMVRGDLKDTNQQIGMVRDDLKGTINTVSGLFKKTEDSLNASIGKVGKPDPPELAKLQFSLWPGDRADPLLLVDSVPDDAGILHVDFTFRNISMTAAKAIDIWVELCVDCAYNKEPDGFDRPSGLDERTRHRFVQQINPGVSFAKTAVEVKSTKAFDNYQFGFRYSCETCGNSTAKQRLVTVYVPNTKKIN